MASAGAGAGPSSEGLGRGSFLLADLGAIAIIVGSFGSWAKQGSVSLSGFGSLSQQELGLYPELDGVFAPGWLTVAMGILILAALLLYVGRPELRWPALIADLAATVALAVAIIAIIDISGAENDLGSAKPGWGVIAVAAGGLLTSMGATALYFFRAPRQALGR